MSYILIAKPKITLLFIFYLLVIPISNYGIDFHKKKALLIGVSLKGDKATASCIDDVIRFKDLLLSKGFKESDIIAITSESVCKKNIILDTITFIAKQLLENDLFVFFYSGHGGNVKDIDGDELDRCKNSLKISDTCVNITCDNNSTYSDQTYELYNDYILDDDLFERMKSFKKARILHITNSCHSGTIYKILKKNNENDMLHFRKDTQTGVAFTSELIHYGATSDSRSIIGSASGGNIFVNTVIKIFNKYTALTYYNFIRYFKGSRVIAYYAEHGENGCYVSDKFKNTLILE